MNIHRRLGLLLGIPLIAIGATGACLAFHDEIRDARPPYRLEHPAPRLLSPAELVAETRRRCANRTLKILFLPNDVDLSARARVADSSGRESMVFLDPGSGRILAERDAQAFDPLEFIYRLHRGKVLGPVGETLAALAGAGLVGLAILGIILWRGRREAAAAGRGARNGGQRPSVSAHRLIGSCLGLLLALQGATGALLVVATALKRARRDLPTATVAKDARTPPPLFHLLSSAQSAHAESRIARLYFSGPTATPSLVLFEDGVELRPDPATGAFPGKAPDRAPFAHWLYRVHSFRFAGLFGSVVMLGAGLGLSAAVLTGLRVSLKFGGRRSQPKDKAPDVSTCDARSSRA